MTDKIITGLPETDHTRAFDAGFEAANKGQSNECPIDKKADPTVRDAWLRGHAWCCLAEGRK